MTEEPLIYKRYIKKDRSPGAGIFAQTIKEVRNQIPDACVEVLVPDFQGSREALITVLNARPDVLNHNIETIPRLYPFIRPEASFKRSLLVLKTARLCRPEIITKSGLMVGLGETEEEVIAAGSKHAKEVHGYTDKQLSDPSFQVEVKKAIKKKLSTVSITTIPRGKS